jgi:flagellar biosynthesis protein FlhF
VVFALDEEPEPAPAVTPSAPWQDLAKQVNELRAELERTADALSRTQTLSATLLADPDLNAAFSSLLAADLHPTTAQELIYGARTRTEGLRRSPDAACWRRAVQSELETRLKVCPILGKASESRRIVAVVGPPGVGKTTTLVKLAARFGLTGRRPAVLFSLDNHRVGAADQLRAFASIMGLTLELIETPAAFRQALAAHENKDLVLIDTPGIGAKDLDVVTEISAILMTCREIDVHLVLNACAKTADLFHAASRFQAFRPAKLIATHADEAENLGSITSLALRRVLPFSFITNGQVIPEDLLPADAGSIASLVLRTPTKSSPAVAAAA